MNPSAKRSGVEGQHWLLDFASCQCPSAVLADSAHLQHLCESACDDAGMTRLGSVFHQFQGGGGGVTGIIALSESHLSVHTWPDEKFAAIDVYVCNHERNNTDRGERLVRAMEAAFRPGAADSRQVARRSPSATPSHTQPQ